MMGLELEHLGMIQDIPKLYTAIAEWLACLVYIVIYKREKILNRRDGLILLMSFLALMAIQMLIGIIPVDFWLLGMLVAVLVMYGTLYLSCQCPPKLAGYILVRAFILGEMVASLEWNLYYFLRQNFSNDALWLRISCLLVVYGFVYLGVAILESKIENVPKNISKKELSMTVLIGVACFFLSNLSYVHANTPFSSPIASQAFTIRPLIDIGGYAFLLAFHIQRCDAQSKRELAAIENILKHQYLQYKQSQETIEMINHKYHDLKHQISILRHEKNSDKKEAYLDEIEEGIKAYEYTYETGNQVLDTLLSGAGLKCARREITLTCVCDGRLLNSIAVMDLCTIFGNALDNAIEYEGRVADVDKRLIHVSVSQMNAFILIRIENYLESEVVFEGGLPISTKKDPDFHGFGTKSILYTIEKYNGNMTVKTEDNWYVINILIPFQ